MSEGWESSAQAWIADMGEAGDFSRQYILDDPMMARVRAAQPTRVLDIGSGEGRFCRMLAAEGISATGLEPTAALRAVAEAKDPKGTYVAGVGEDLPFADQDFDLAVFYLSLIDIEDFERAYAEAIRVLRPGGRLLIANLSSFATALPDDVERGWLRHGEGHVFACDNYQTERSFWIGWRGIRVRNHHRTLERYMRPLIGAGLTLSHFAEPAPSDGPPLKVSQYRRAPMFVMMEWLKPH